MCGIIGVIGTKDSSLLTYYGLHALQHRGQEAAGILSSNFYNGKYHFSYHKGLGLVSEIFNDNTLLTKELAGKSSIGHTRYSTTGSSDSRKNIQPFYVQYRNGNLAVAHNGNITNADILRDKLIEQGAIFQTSSDTEVILHLIATSRKKEQVEQIKDALTQLEGAFSLVILIDGKLIAARDKNGFRPLCIGKKEDCIIVTSETCALDINSAEYIRDIEPGEILIIDENEILNTKSVYLYENEKTKISHCIFEFIYFSRPDSKIFNTNVDKIRRKLGKILAQNHPVIAPNDEKVIVISVPDSSNTIAIGYQAQLAKMNIKSKFDIGLLRSHYIGRTFISPEQGNREIGVKIKFNIVKGVLESRTIVIIDDSIVRGTTSKQLVKLIKEANPKSIHLRIASPQILYPCFYGMDFPSKEELIAHKLNGNLEAIKNYLEVDSIEYLTIPEMLDAIIDHDKNDFCTACFSGKYPVQITNEFSKTKYDN
ncbi:MAG: amidophosphoribosyltransferase [Ignavibacteriales bacterium]|nr:amidophosphoribosyltransferase [Ignavibacteriales bacterium]